MNLSGFASQSCIATLTISMSLSQTIFLASTNAAYTPIQTQTHTYTTKHKAKCNKCVAFRLKILSCYYFGLHTKYQPFCFDSGYPFFCPTFHFPDSFSREFCTLWSRYWSSIKRTRNKRRLLHNLFAIFQVENVTWKKNRKNFNIFHIIQQIFIKFSPKWSHWVGLSNSCNRWPSKRRSRQTCKNNEVLFLKNLPPSNLTHGNRWSKSSKIKIQTNNHHLFFQKRCCFPTFQVELKTSCYGSMRLFNI